MSLKQSPSLPKVLKNNFIKLRAGGRNKTFFSSYEKFVNKIFPVKPDGSFFLEESSFFALLFQRQRKYGI